VFPDLWWLLLLTLRLCDISPVYSFGTNSNGELGTGDQEAKLDPTQAEGSLKSKYIVEIKSCESTVLAVTGMAPFFVKFMTYPL
jgi:alpha-tubulin suppressor-like RCC1 family protein